MKYVKPGGGGGSTSVPVSSVSAYPSSVTLSVGEWFYGTYTVVCPSNATNKNVTWSSSNTNVATVNASSGYIYAKAAGTATIYATASDGSGKRDSIAVTVGSSCVLVNSITLNRTRVSLGRGGSYVLSATVSPSNATNKSVTWSSSNPSVASVSGGRVCAIANGSATITASANDGSGKSASCTIIVTGEIQVTSVSVDPPCMTLTAGNSAYAHVTVYPTDATNRCVLWTSNNTEVATVNYISGLIYAKKSGMAMIFATAQDGSDKQGSCLVTVTGTVYVNRISIDSGSITLEKNEGMRLSATVFPENASNPTIRWSSCDSSIAEVDPSTGYVYAKAAGITKIYVFAQDGSGVTNYCTVVVKETVTAPEPEKPESTVDGSTFADPVDVYRGAHTLKNHIMTLFGGQGLAFVLQYDSARLASGVFGAGWYHNYEKRLEIDGAQAKVYSSPSVYSLYEANEENTAFICTTANKNGYILTVDQTQQYPYKIDCNSDHTEYYNINGYLAKIVDHQGFETEISYSGSVITITDSVSGKKMYLEKNADGKVIKVYDDASRQATFTYNGNLLVGICDLNENSLAYTYDEQGRIKSGTDSKNICYFENTYDDCGRVIRQKDGIAGSLPSIFSYESDGKRLTTDRNGNQSIRIFDSNGLLVSHTDENGNTKTYTYDDRYNVIKETDAKGNSVVKAYNSFNKPTEIIDKNGNKIEITYDTAGNVVKIRYPETCGTVSEETFIYNTRNQLTQHTDLRGTVTVYTYDAAAMPASKKVGSRNAVQYSYQNGLLVSQTDAKGNTVQYGHNAIGQVSSKTDAENHTTSYEYDAFGNLLKVTDTNGKTVVTTYDGNHQKTSVTDANGNRTEYSYNGNMKNNAVTLPDAHSITYEFDGEDRPIKMTDQAGNITLTQYDKAGRMISKQFPDGGTVQYEYDEAGNVVKEINPKGAVSTKTYDAAGNVLSVTDDEGNVTRYQYNAISKLVRAVNAVSGTTIYEYSAAGDLLSETDALGGKKTYTYDAFGNQLTATDAKGNTTTYTYDANDNLLTVKDALNHVTTYTYNSLNQLVSVKDAKNNTVTYGYDALGRRTTITDAKNNVFTTVYDANGNVLKTLDAKGNPVSETTYNSLNLPATVTDATGKTTTYTYNALGKVATATDSMNHCQEYTYNSRGQNTGVVDAADNLSSATYDTLGKITALTGPLGGSTSYTYDDMGRLISETTATYYRLCRGGRFRRLYV